MTDDPSAVAQPARLRWLPWTVYAWCAMNLLGELTLFWQRGFLGRHLVKANAKMKKPKPGYVLGSSQVHHDVTILLRFGLVYTVLTALILILVTVSVMRGRWWARWLLIGLATILPIPFSFLNIGVLVQLIGSVVVAGTPFAYRVPECLGGLAALAVLVLLFSPDVREYFARARAGEAGKRGRLVPQIGQNSAPVVRRSGTRAVGGLFGPRRAAAAATLPEPVVTQPAAPANSAAPRPKRAKAKSREQ